MTGQGIGAWGAAETRFFYELTPDRILDAVEAAGLRPTGRCYALNSMENRVYDVEIEIDGAARTPSDRFRVIKFYRPGRWTNDQILAEHEFLEELDEHELPVVPPITMEVGSTLAAIEDTGLRYAIWPRIGGRIADELDDEKLRRLGRLMARVHNIGEVGVADERIRLDVNSYGRDNLAYLLEHDVLPADVRDAYRSLVEQLCDTVEPWFEGVACQRIHGDCHIGNVLWRDDDPYLVDFDDMVRGPCVQDLWLIVPGRDTVAVRDRETFLEAYEELRGFDRSTLRLVEPLRALRYIHFTAWIARRQDDPAFQRVFSDFGSERYWFEQISGLREIPTPNIIHVPVGVKLVGLPSSETPQPVTIDAPMSFLGLSQLVFNLVADSPFRQGAPALSQYAADLPQTQMVGENEATVTMKRTEGYVIHTPDGVWVEQK